MGVWPVGTFGVHGGGNRGCCANHLICNKYKQITCTPAALDGSVPEGAKGTKQSNYEKPELPHVPGTGWFTDATDRRLRTTLALNHWARVGGGKQPTS